MKIYNLDNIVYLKDQYNCFSRKKDINVIDYNKVIR